MYLYWRNGPYHGPTLSFSWRKELDHQRDLDSGEMQLEHAGILDLGRLKYVSAIKLVVKCKLAQGVLYGIRLCGLPMRAVRFVSFCG